MRSGEIIRDGGLLLTYRAALARTPHIVAPLVTVVVAVVPGARRAKHARIKHGVVLIAAIVSRLISRPVGEIARACTFI